MLEGDCSPEGHDGGKQATRACSLPPFLDHSSRSKDPPIRMSATLLTKFSPPPPLLPLPSTAEPIVLLRHARGERIPPPRQTHGIALILAHKEFRTHQCILGDDAMSLPPVLTFFSPAPAPSLRTHLPAGAVAWTGARQHDQGIWRDAQGRAHDQRL